VLAAGGQPIALPDEDFPWQRIDSAPFLFCEAFLGAAADDRASVLAAGVAALPRLEDPDDAADLAVWLVRLALPAPGDQLDDAQRAAARALATTDAAWHYTDLGRVLAEKGYPSEREAFAALSA